MLRETILPSYPQLLVSALRPTVFFNYRARDDICAHNRGEVCSAHLFQICVYLIYDVQSIQCLVTCITACSADVFVLKLN